MPDFVITYVESDRPWANWAAWEIERSGFRVDLLRADRPGWSGAGADDHTDRTHVPLLSAAYWRQAHRAAIWWWLGEAIERHVSPILVGAIDASIPADEFLDLTGATDPTAAAKHVRRYLQIAMRDKAPRKSSRLFGRDRPGFPPDLAPVWRIGSRRSDLIAGADALIALEHTFAGARSGTTRITVTGAAGAGKTGLAIEYAHRHAAQYAGCWSIEASIPALLPVQLRELAKFRQTSEVSGIWLLVLDDVADPDDIAPLPPGDWHVIVTSLRPPAAPADSAHLRLGSPVPAGAAKPIDQSDVIAAAIERVRTTAPPAAVLLHVLSALGPASVPIPMLIAGADGARSDLAGPLSARTELDDVIGVLCAAGLTRRTPDTVVVSSVVRQAVLSGVADVVSIGQARNVVMLATLAYAMRTTAPADWLPLLPHVVTCLDVPTASPTSLSLLDYMDGWDSGDLQRVPLAAALEAASTVLYKLDEPALALELADRGSSLATDSRNSSETAHIRAAVHRASMLRFAKHPADALAEINRAERMATAPIDPDYDSDRRLPFEPADLLVVKAQILADMDDVDGALQTMDRMWALAAAGGLSLPRDTRPHQRVHANLLAFAGRFAEALDRLDLNVAASVPDDDSEAGLCHTLRAALYLNLNRPAEALRHAEIAVGIIVDTDNNDDLLHPRLHRADALRRLGDLPAALNEATEVISLARVNANDAVLVDALAMAGDILADLHNTERAIAMHCEARALAAEHDLPLTSRVVLDHRAGDVYLYAGRVDEASALLRGTVVAMDSDPGRVPVETCINVLTLLAHADLMRSQPAEAVPLLVRTVQLVHDNTVPDRCYRESFYLLGTALSDLGRPMGATAVLEPALAAVDLASEDAAETDATIRLALARARREAGDAAGALEVLQAVPDQITSRPRTHGDLVARLLFERAKALFDLGNRADGLRQIAFSVDMASAVSPQTRGVADLLEKIGDFLLAIQEPDSADQYIRRALDVTSDLYGEESLQFAKNLDNLGRARVAQHRAHSALIPNHMALRITRERLGPDHPTVAIRLHNLGHAMIATGQPREATKFLWEAVRIDTLTYGPSHPEVRQDLLMLASALQNAGDVTAAREAATMAWAIGRDSANSPGAGLS